MWRLHMHAWMCTHMHTQAYNHTDGCILNGMIDGPSMGEPGVTGGGGGGGGGRGVYSLH